MNHPTTSSNLDGGATRFKETIVSRRVQNTRLPRTYGTLERGGRTMKCLSQLSLHTIPRRLLYSTPDIDAFGIKDFVRMEPL